MSQDAVSAQLPKRLQRYSRIVALIGEQLDAVRSGNSERLHQARTERAMLESELELKPIQRQSVGTADSKQDSSTGGEHQGDELDQTDSERVSMALQSDLNAALALLASLQQARRETEENWDRIQDDAVRSARTVPALRIAGQSYPDYERGEPRVDLRF